MPRVGGGSGEDLTPGLGICSALGTFQNGAGWLFLLGLTLAGGRRPFLRPGMKVQGPVMAGASVQGAALEGKGGDKPFQRFVLGKL